MNTEMTYTGEDIKFENGKRFQVYSKMTKTGERFYWFSRSQCRYFPISRKAINEFIVL